ncbi:MAG: hypothetical protein DIU61_012605 [Bacteroidota bacterium]|jgi:hypothetical protein|nr:MAG: hypothetical protein DIU61_10630 [Bacteroidota bacterium]
MNIARRLAIYAVLVVILSSCFDPPEYSVIPQIEFNDIAFVDVGDFSAQDSLILWIDFKDGDGDLGLSPNDPRHISEPYHDSDYFLEDGSGGLIPIPKEVRYTDIPPMLKLTGQQGKLASIRTRKKPLYSYLPGWRGENCPASFVRNGVPDTIHYSYQKIYISEEDGHIIDNTYQIIDTLTAQDFPDIYIVEDTVLVKPNPLHNNIRVDWLVQGNDGNFHLFDWSEVSCTPIFNARFPVLEDETRAIEGTLQYTMKTFGLVPLFSIKTLKLRITIWDRALHKSNVVETPPFTLNDIRRGG